METLKDIRKAYRDAERGSSRGGLSLPRLDPAPSPGLLSTRTSCQPVPPKDRQRTSPVLLSVAEPSQLTQSAPSVMEPRLCSNIVTQARAHIQTRLACQDTGNGQKFSRSPLLALHPRTPKLLAPLDCRPRVIATLLPGLKHHVPLKPISRSPLCFRARLRRERLSWGSSRTGLLTTKGGSEESRSSSSSSQSSFDMEDEEDERDVLRARERRLKFVGGRLEQRSNDASFAEADAVGETRRFKVQSSISHIPPIRGSAHDLDGEPINRASDLLSTEKATNSHYEGKANNVNYTKEPAGSQSFIKYNYAQQGDSEISITSKNQPDPEPESSFGITFNMNNDEGEANASCEGTYRNEHIKQTEGTMKDSRCEETRVDNVIPHNEDVKGTTSDTEEEIQLFSSAVNLPQSDMDPKRDERMLKALKSVRNKERRTSVNCDLRGNIQTGQQPFNVQAHKDRSVLNRNKSTGNLKEVKDKTRKSPELMMSGETVKKVKSKLKSVKGDLCHAGTPSPIKKLIDQGRRANLDKVNRAQQHPPVREVKSIRQSKRSGPTGTQRSKSTVDFITYKDMFQQIQSRDEGPAIYEMFAGPVFDNLRVSSSCEKVKNRQVQSAPPRKTQQCHKVKHRPLKQVQRRSPGDSVAVSAKSKPKLVSSRVKPHLAAAPRKGMLKIKDTPQLDIEICHRSTQETMLSTVEEDLSRYGSETVKSDDKTLTPAASSHSRLHVNMQELGNPKRSVPEGLLSPRSHQQPRINTWTLSGSGHATVSPIYQKYLDEVGDGPLTDDLLQCLAEELISLDERDVSVGPENLESNREDSPGNFTDGAALLGSELVVDDAITWTKGEVLGRGAYGTVYCGLTSRGQLIAVKQVSLDASDHEAAKREYGRLQEEVELLKNLRHTNIVGFLGTSLHRHVVSIFMEYIPGGSIASILHRFGPLPERVLALYTQQILEGVAYLHLNRVIHRDLKGNNVMLMPTGIIKLIDFGCARRLSCLNHHAASNSGELLKSVHGTPYWMAPEVINETGYGRKSDIWSVGCTVFEMATGKPPLAHMDKLAALFYIGAQRGIMPSLPNGFSDNAKDFVKISLMSDQRLRPSADQLLKHPFIPRSATGARSWETHKKCCGHPERLCG